MAVEHSKFSWTEMEREQFLRIANARLRSVYNYEPQRKAWCANMWVRYIERKKCDLSTN